MNNLLNKYLNEVCSFIKCKDIHSEVKQELGSHIEETYEFYLSRGFDEHIAMEKAINEMGDSCEIGRKMNEQHKFQTNWHIIILTMIISLFGIAITFISSRLGSDIVAISFGRYILYTMIGFGVLAATYFIDYMKFKKYPYLLLGAGFLLSVFTMFFGTPLNGAIRYVSLGIFTFNVSPAVSILFFLGFSGLIDKYKENGSLAILKLGVLGAATILPFLFFPDLSAAIILIITYGVLLFTAIIKGHFDGNKIRQALTLLAVGVAGGALIMIRLFLWYQPERFITFVERGANDPNGYGWMMVMVDKALHASNWFGKADVLPEGNFMSMLPGITSEYALLNVIINFGLAAGLVLIIVIAFLIIRMFVTSYKIKNTFGFYVSLAASSFFAAQFILNILINFNLFPYCGVVMPFVSYSGTAYIMYMFIIGIILSIWRRNNIISNSGISKQMVKHFVIMNDGKLVIDFNMLKPSILK